MSEVKYPFSLEELREQQAKFNSRHDTGAKLTELPPAYAAKLNATQAEATQGLEEDVIIARALKAIARPQKAMPQVMDYQTAKRIVWKIGNGILEQCKRVWQVEKENKEAIENLVKYFINDPSGKYDTTKGLYIFGDVGRGKTFLFTVMKHFADAATITCKQFRVAHCGDIADKVLWAKDTTTSHLAEYQSGAWLFDDLGNEPGAIKTYGNEVQVMERLLIQRYAKFVNGFCLTHITSNDTPDELMKKYGTRLADRANEMFSFIFLKGESKRK